MNLEDLEAPATRLELLATHHAVGTAISLLVEALSETAPGLRDALLDKLATSTNEYSSKTDPVSEIGAAVLSTIRFALA